MNGLNILRQQREALLAAAARHHASNVRVFGSVLRGEDGPDSDIDLLVDFAQEASLFDLLALQEEVTRLTGHRADIVTAESLSIFLRPRILASAQPL